MTKGKLFVKTLGLIALIFTSMIRVNAQTLIASYSFQNTLTPSSGVFGSAVANNSTVGYYSVCTNNTNDAGLTTPSITSLSTTNFQIEFTVRLTSMPTVSNAPLFVINGGTRYFGLLLNQSGQLKVLYNNSYETSPASGITLTTNTDYNIQIQYLNGVANLVVNNNNCLVVSLPTLDYVNSDRTIYLGDHPGAPSSSAAINGCYSDLRIYNNPTSFSPVLSFINHPTGGNVALNTIQVFDAQTAAACNYGAFWNYSMDVIYFDNLMKYTNNGSGGTVLVITESLTHPSYTWFKTVMENRDWQVSGSTNPAAITLATLNSYDLVIIGCTAYTNTTHTQAVRNNTTFNTALQDYVLANNGDVIITGWALADGYSPAGSAFLTTLNTISPFSSFTYADASGQNGIFDANNSLEYWEYTTPYGHFVFSSPVTYVGAPSGSVIGAYQNYIQFGCTWAIRPSTYTLRPGAVSISGVQTNVTSPPVGINSVATIVNPSASAVTYCQNSTATTLTATKTDFTHYQWQESSTGPSSYSWSNISGALSKNYTPSTSTPGTKYYRCLWYNGYYSNSSPSGAITVVEVPVITTNPTTTLSMNCFDASSTTAITVATSASSPTYQWQVSTDNVTFINATSTNGSGVQSPSFIPSHSDIGQGNIKYYRCIVTSNGCSTTSNSKPFGIHGATSAGSTNLPSSATLSAGTNLSALTFTINNALSYQWYVNTTNSTTGGTAISGATTASYTAPTTIAELGTKYYYCVATTCTGSNTSGVATVNVTQTYYSKSSATNFNTLNSWGTNTDGTGTAPTSFSGYTDLIIQNGAQVSLSASATVRSLTINTGKLSVGSNTLTISIPNQNNTELNVTNGGTLEVTGGSVVINGAAYFADGSGLTQSGGLISLDPSSGSSATSIGGVNSNNITFGIGYAAGSTASPISTAANALKFNCTGGTIQIIDPSPSTNAGVAALGYNATSDYVTFGSNHTFKFGDGVSNTAGGSVNGFLINTKVSGGYLSFGNFTVDVLSGTNRMVINSGSTVMVTENLTVTSGEFRQNVPTYISGNLTNEGTYASQSGVLNFAKFVNGVETPATNAQIITGNGYFYNTGTSAPNLTNFSSVSFNNISAGGITFASANSLKSTPSFVATLSAYLYFKNGVVHTGNNIFYSIQSNPINYTAGGFGSGSTYARLYDGAYGGTGINAGQIPSFGRMSFPFVSGNPVTGMKARHFHRGTGAMNGFLVVKFTEAPGLTSLQPNVTESSVTYDLQTNSTWEVSTTGTITGTTNFCIQNEDGFPTSTSNVILARNGAIVNNPAGGSSQPMGQRSGLTGSNQVGTFTLATSSPAINYTWTGATSTDWATASNWSPALVPNSANVTIPSSGITNFPEVAAVTIATGKTLTLQADSKLNVTGVLTNNGTMTIESGATLVQGSSSTLAGTGTYNVKQAITGDGTTTPSGRFWYLGSPVATSSSSVLFANTANVVKKRDEATNAWIALASGTPENLSVGRGYYTQAMANSTVTFTGGNINNGTVNISNLSRTSGVNFEGFNLVSNPYPSYLDWDLVTKTNVGNTMWYRTATGNTAGSMVFETYVAGAAGGIGTNLSGNVATKLIPPMQAFWVRVNQGQTTGSLTLNNSMRSHFSSISGSTAGLRSTNDELKVFLRMNLLQEDKKDQLIVYMNGAATNGFDILDGEKMMQAGTPQFYTKAGDKKIVINGLNSAKKQHSLPITMELPTTGVHTFEIENLELETGLVWLEDVQEGTMEAITEGYTYLFYGEAGINADRFVLHFNILDNSAPSAPNYGEVNSSANFSGKGANVHAEAAGVVVIKLPASTEGVTDIQIRDAAGRLVYTGSTNSLETSVQLEQANGIYYVTLNSNAGVEVRKVFIQQ